jgi:hypothetical protein
MATRRNRGRRIILRERNEHGFKECYINILTRVEGYQILETDSLIETRRRLLDATGTLSLLLNDLLRGGVNSTGLSSNHMSVPIQDLKLSLIQLIN